jgi:hypothetical protein
MAPVRADAHVLVRPQHTFRIVDGRAEQEGAGGGVVRRIGERDLAGIREEVAVDHLHFDDELALVGQLEQPARTSFLMRSISFSEMLKLIHIGVSTETVVSCAFCGLRYVPSATTA